MHRIVFTALLLLFWSTGEAQIVANKLVDEGGSGPYAAVAVTEETLPDFVVYRPQDLDQAVEAEGKLPVVIWANGGCMNSSIHHERLLSEVASHGYVIVAIGELQMKVEDRTHEHTPDDELLRGLDWIAERAETERSDYFQQVDLDKVAVAGMSCGGAQVMRISGEPRATTYLMFNSGMGDMTMAGASNASLTALHGPILYVLGGETDVAYQNALIDYDRIDHVPVAFANHATAGHGGTFAEPNGGSFARMALDWLDWQLKGSDTSATFLGGDLDEYPDWTVKSKHFTK
ncbi:chlorophyllase-like protein [Neolewinella xylanilytica]|uniref:Chlorophyllase-like protein n=2 Tax=Neolewinella xylanilytica TaxID=1514080 RepID=A0A2S6IAI0_9BACT|nr:chlorophyllase-like protein [Neolewinella xylanilytica]